MNLIIEILILALAFIGGHAVAGWVGVLVVAAFVVTTISDMVVSMRSPRARLMRDIEESLPDDEDLHLVGIKRMRLPHAHPMDPTAYGSNDED